MEFKADKKVLEFSLLKFTNITIFQEISLTVRL